jgi:hypothetical protein
MSGDVFGHCSVESLGELGGTSVGAVVRGCIYGVSCAVSPVAGVGVFICLLACMCMRPPVPSEYLHQVALAAQGTAEWLG